MKDIINNNDIKKCGIFCRQIVEKENQYNRMKEPNELRMFRTYIGKIGELYIDKLRYFLNNNNSISEFEYNKDMFDIYDGKENVDDADFLLNSLTVDIKTIYANDHKNIVIPKDQPMKDIYICSKIITNSNWSSSNFNPNKDRDWRNNIHKMARDVIDFECIGFIKREKVLEQPIKNFGNDAYFVKLDKLDTDPKKIKDIIQSLSNTSKVQKKSFKKNKI